MTMNTTDPGGSLAAEESLAVEKGRVEHPVRNAFLIALAAMAALLVLVELSRWVADVDHQRDVAGGGRRRRPRGWRSR